MSSSINSSFNPQFEVGSMGSVRRIMKNALSDVNPGGTNWFRPLTNPELRSDAVDYTVFTNYDVSKTTLDKVANIEQQLDKISKALKLDIKA